jgi:hypothetical protein
VLANGFVPTKTASGVLTDMHDIEVDVHCVYSSDWSETWRIAPACDVLPLLCYELKFHNCKSAVAGAHS